MFQIAIDSHPDDARRSYVGPERRAGALRQPQWTQDMLDELDHAILLLSPDLQLMLMNHSARDELDEPHPLQVLGRELRAREPRDVALLHDALMQASVRGLRRLITLGVDEHRVSVAIVPLLRGGQAGPFACMVSLGKRRMCERLSVQCFAHEYGLTRAEERVLEALCDGLTPRDVAQHFGVGLATVRTQLGCIRSKTGARDMRALIQQVAMLPPMVSRLRHVDIAGTPLRCVHGDIQARAA